MKFTNSDRLRTMTKRDLVDYIVAAWNTITQDMIKQIFEIIGRVCNIKIFHAS